MNINERFQWVCQPEAEKVLMRYLETNLKRNVLAAELDTQLLAKTSTRLFDWIDHFIVSDSPENREDLENTGFALESGTDTPVYSHPGAMFPRILLAPTGVTPGLALMVESIADFLMVRGISRPIEGSLFAPYRRCLISEENHSAFWVVERRGTRSLAPVHTDSKYLEAYIKGMEIWQTRDRHIRQSDAAFKHLFHLADALVSSIGKDVAAWVVLDCERRYWESRNTAGQVQKDRQDKLGMGWANHDHHTFRSSRHNFQKLVQFFELLGFHCRERFYAGAEAGWGAQVMENEKARLVLFLDVDLDPHELNIDFAHDPLEERDHLGTIGLWCALHGDSIFQAGMHHLEAQFMFDHLTQDLATFGIGMMKPFSSFTYLQQAFTNGERWQVNPRRIQELLETRRITQEQALRFEKEGAVGSHLENLQRREGYKGFNQKNVSFIIKETDPRTIHATGA